MKTVFAIVAVAALSACASSPTEPLRATAQLQPSKGSKALGEATFEQVGDKVHLLANVSHLKPGQEHGFHIHEVGDCSSGDGMSTKGHFNPFGKPHAHPGSGHAGDLPALKADKGGRATLDVMVEGITVGPGTASIVGRGLIVHADPDDYKTQPTGNAGARIACGVIKAE
jgi:Cu-Zn family superoxide dismutase